MIPIGPFLFGYFFIGLGAVLDRFEISLRRKGFEMAFQIWVALFVIMDVNLLIRGNGRTYGGLSPLASPTAEDYYLGYWHDLYVTSHALKVNPEPGSISLAGINDWKYVTILPIAI